MKRICKHIIEACLIIIVLFFAVTGFAGNEPPPLPLHGVEGTGGVFSTHCAYLVNPAPEGKVLGKPSIGACYVNIGQGRHLNAITVTETLWDRVELGYAWNYLDVGDLKEAVSGVGTIDRCVDLHNFNLRVNTVKEGGFNMSWMPAVTLGIHYKDNHTIDGMDDDLGGVLSNAVKVKDDSGFDYTMYMTKMVKALPVPLIINFGLRSSEAAHLGLLGFTDDRELLIEGNIIAFLSGRLAVAAEYRQKPNEYDELPGLIEEEEDWWTLCACYVASNNMTISGGYGHFGDVLNHQANKAFGLKVKWEF